MANMEEMNLAYADAYIDIVKSTGTTTIYSDSNAIDSIAIRTGCYDGSAIGVGCVYDTQCTIVMDEVDGILNGTELRVAFNIGNAGWKTFGTFFVSELPTYTDEKMTINAYGSIWKNGSKMYTNEDFYLLKKPDESGDAMPIHLTVDDVLQSLAGYGIKVEYDRQSDFAKAEVVAPSNLFDASAGYITKGISVKELLAGLAIMYGGNVVERNGVAYLTPKQGFGEGGNFSTTSCDSSYEYSRISYGIQSLSLSHLPTKKDYILSLASDEYDTPEIIKEFLVYSGTERTTRDILVSQGDTGANVKYNQTVECDWVGHEKGFLGGCYVQGDLTYRTGNFTFPGYNEKLYAGNLINIYLDDDTFIPFVIGEMNLEWDGGFTTEISCQCTVDASTGTYLSSTASPATSSQNMSSATSSFYENMFAKKEDLEEHIKNKNVHLIAKEIEDGIYSHRVGINSGEADGVNSFIGGGLRNKADGSYSSAGGYETEATGSAAVAQNYKTKASGRNSMASGSLTEASGASSYSANRNTLASGENSMAIGYSTTASGDNSFSSGHKTESAGTASHAEGNSTNALSDVVATLEKETVKDAVERTWKENKFLAATGVASHSENQDNIATGNYSHSEGFETAALSEASHSEGKNSEASGKASHAENGSTATGDYSHSEGTSAANGNKTHSESESIANGDGSHAENSSTADGDYSHSEGISNASGKYSHSESDSNAEGENSHSENNAAAYGFSSHAENASKSYGKHSHSEGSGKSGEENNTEESNSFQHSEGKGTVATGLAAHSEGLETIAFGEASHSSGSQTTASGKCSVSAGSLTVASGENSVASGKSSKSAGETSFSHGISSEAIGKGSVATGENTTAFGELSKASGASTTKATEKITNISSNTTYPTIKSAWNTNKFSLAFGNSSKVSGKDCIAFGAQSSASGIETIAQGEGGHSEGKGTTAGGYDSNSKTANTKNSHAEGENTTAYLNGSHSEGLSSNKSSDVVTSIVTAVAEGKLRTLWSSKKFSLAYGAASHAEGQDCVARTKYSHSEGLETWCEGEASHSEGKGTHTTGSYSHSEGLESSASGKASHSEGEGTMAVAANSHSEGYKTESRGIASHSEGSETDANGESSHSEGIKTLASGRASHSEGDGSMAKDECSHTEGLKTVSTGTYSHVQGKYNAYSSTVRLAHVIGNGTSDTDRKNIHTVDWSGNAWYAGDVTNGDGVSLNGLKELIDSGGEGGTSDYANLSNKPQIEGIELLGNKTFEELGIHQMTETETLEELNKEA